MLSLNLTSNIVDRFEAQNLSIQYGQSSPFPHIVLDQFIDSQFIQQLRTECRQILTSEMKHFKRKNSQMREFNNIDPLRTPVAFGLISHLHSRTFIHWLETITGQRGLIPDPHLIGAGYMRCFKGDKLEIHSDFNWNEELKLHRAVNLIIYLNSNWQKEWNGDLQFWNENQTECKTQIYPFENRCVIWNYDKKAFHGHPNELNCPENESRDGFRLFYYKSNSVHLKDDPPHKSLYWYDRQKNEPYNIESPTNSEL